MLTDRSDDRRPSAAAREDEGGEIAALKAAISMRRFAERLLESRVSRNRCIALTADLPDTSMCLLDRDMRILIAEGEGMRGLPWVAEDMHRGRVR